MILYSYFPLVYFCTLLDKQLIKLQLQQEFSLIIFLIFVFIFIICFIISKVGTYKLQNRFAKFILRIVAYFTFWMSLVYGVALYFIIKYEGL